MKSVRVSRANPCPICNKDSWCLVSSRSVLCMRVVSNNPVTLKSGETGYAHALDSHVEIRPQPAKRDDRPVFGEQLVREWARTTTDYQTRLCASSLGVTVDSLKALGACFSNAFNAWAFPMKSWCNNVVGIRLRSDNGFKWAVPGSRQGIFLPSMKPDQTCVVVEGPTDTAAVLSMGFYAIGRPSCSGGLDDILRAIKCRPIRRVIILSDNDGPGLKGAEVLSSRLDVSNVVLNLPCKDIREFARKGGTREDVEALADCKVWL